MVEIAFLKHTEDKQIFEEICPIFEFSCRIHVVYIPFKNRIKRRIKSKLIKILSNFEYVLTDNEKLTAYEKGKHFKSLFYYYPSETIAYITKNAPCSSVAVVSADVTALLKKTVLRLGSFFRIVTIYTIKENEMRDFAEGLYESVGLPIHVKPLGMHEKPSERFLIRISEDITLFDAETHKEYIDLAVTFRFPLSKYKTLPLTDILKVCLDSGFNYDMFSDGKVKIVGEISK